MPHDDEQQPSEETLGIEINLCEERPAFPQRQITSITDQTQNMQQNTTEDSEGSRFPVPCRRSRMMVFGQAGAGKVKHLKVKEVDADCQQ